MPASIAAPVNQSARVRELRKRHPYFTDQDLVTLTGIPLKNVKAALGKGEARRNPKSAAPAAG